MERHIGTVSRGIRCPIIREGDDLAAIVAESVLAAARAEQIAFHDRDIICVTESVVARAQGNYASVDDIGQEVKEQLGGDTIGVIFPILSRNRFAICLKGIARGAKKVVLMLSYPADEVGNQLVTWDMIDAAGIDPYTDVLTLDDFRRHFGVYKHPFTGMDYVAYYKELIEKEGAEAEILFANRPEAILGYTKRVLHCDIHSRFRTARLLQKAGAEKAISLTDLLSTKTEAHGYNPQYGLLGSNKATETTVKLFPRDCTAFAQSIADRMKAATGKNLEAMVYGDGAFQDPVGQIWELADPVVSPGYTKGLEGTPNELKLKYLADNDFGDLKGEALQHAIEARIREKTADSLVGQMASQGTTPRRLTDLIGSLCDLTSGSGDKGTPVVFIQGYFDNYTNE